MHAGNLANLKLFVHADHLPMLPKTNEGWMNVEYSFWPSEQTPDQLQLVFPGDEREPARTVAAALPQAADALDCIANRQIFAVSQQRLVALHRYCVRRYGMALIERGFEAATGATAEGGVGRVMEVTVDEQKCRVRAEPLFDFMKSVLLYDQRKTIDECGKQFREKTIRQLRLLLIHHGFESSQAIAIEAKMFDNHRGDLLGYYQATKLSPAAIVTNYGLPGALRPNAPRPPVSVAPLQAIVASPPVTVAPPSTNVQRVNMNLNPGFAIDPSGRVVRQVAVVDLAEDEQPNPRVPPELRQVRLPAQQQGVATTTGRMFVIRQPSQQQMLLLRQPQPQVVSQQQSQPQQLQQPQSVQLRFGQTIEESMQQPVTRDTIPQVAKSALPHQQGNPPVQMSQAGNTQNAESVIRVPPMPRELSAVKAQCPFCTMRFDVRSDAFYLHVALVHIPRLVNDDQQNKIQCAINSCGKIPRMEGLFRHLSDDLAIFRFRIRR